MRLRRARGRGAIRNRAKQLERLEAKGFVQRDRTLFVPFLASVVATNWSGAASGRWRTNCAKDLGAGAESLIKAKPLSERNGGGRLRA